MSDLMIEISQLSRFYDRRKVLDQIDLEVKRGEVMGFLGPNGAGKTTTLRILAGLLAPNEGSVRVAGIDILAQPIAAKAKIGFLPETPPLYDDMTVREYLVYLAQLRQVAPGKVTVAVDRAMERCGLVSVANRLLRNLSKGYRQRCGIAQAIVHTPEVVILDEPTVGLDPIQIREIRGLIRELGGDHSVILSTHILPEVQVTCNRVALIHNGRIVLQDSLAGLERHARRERGYRVCWDHPPQEAALRQITTLAEVSQDGNGWSIIPVAGADPIPELVRQSVEQGWGLRELTPVTQSLEEIFVRLATQES
ncbi:MAG: ABC transporter ATP-binding protein [Magnetococcales bacterium]|nr:ABC transporter ATP-binding protein [Magnetococcales bacterium]